jgi:hypothetical protein
MVCSGCHSSMGSTSLSVGATGEFRVPTPEMLDAETSGERPSTTSTCAWCSKRESDVKKLLGRGGIALCNECVSLASDILDAELGQTWR